jgi:hypothetical protein
MQDLKQNSHPKGGYFYLQRLDYLLYTNTFMALEIRSIADSIFSMLLAKDILMQSGSPNARPVTVETCAVFNRYIQRSSASLITSSPILLPK